MGEDVLDLLPSVGIFVGDVEQRLDAVAQFPSQLLQEAFVLESLLESGDDSLVGDVRYLVPELGEAPDVLLERLLVPLSYAGEVPHFRQLVVGTTEVGDELFTELRPAGDGAGQ